MDATGHRLRLGSLRADLRARVAVMAVSLGAAALVTFVLGTLLGRAQ